MDIKDKLKQKRQEAGLTQKELAEILHVSRQTISSWEVGRTYPDLETLVAISELYETPLDDLLKEDSRMVEDITKKVKKSERRKVANIVLTALLLLVAGSGIWTGIERYQNSYVNAEGLSPNDLIGTLWQLHFDPTKDLGNSYLSFETDDMVILNEYGMWGPWITPDMNSEKIHELREEWKEKGLEDGVHTYRDLKVKVDGNQYILTAYGYSQEFTKLSDTIIRDANGIEYRKLGPASHDTLYWMAEEMDLKDD